MCHLQCHLLSRGGWLNYPSLTSKPQTTSDEKFYNCIAICNLVNRGSVVDLDLVTMNIECGKVRQIRAVGAEIAEQQGNTPTLPRYMWEQLLKFQKTDVALQEFRKFWDRQEKHRHQEWKPVKNLLKYWKQVTQKEGLLYRVIQDPKLSVEWSAGSFSFLLV